MARRAGVVHVHDVRAGRYCSGLTKQTGHDNRALLVGDIYRYYVVRRAMA